jgi:ribosomal protein L7/L12
MMGPMTNEPGNAAPRLTQAQEAEVRSIAATQGPIQAIKRYRELTDVGLAEAKEAVEGLTGAPPRLDAAPAGAAPVITDELEAEIADMLRQKAKIPAIKRYREVKNVGLAEAKTAVEAIGKKHGIAESGKCFVATAVFEDEEAPEVQILRHWRDTRLSLHVSGRAFIRAYAVVGPMLAVIPRHSRLAQACLRRMLVRVAQKLNA